MDILSIISFVVFALCVVRLGMMVDKMRREIIMIKERIGMIDE